MADTKPIEIDNIQLILDAYGDLTDEDLEEISDVFDRFKSNLEAWSVGVLRNMAFPYQGQLKIRVLKDSFTCHEYSLVV